LEQPPKLTLSNGKDKQKTTEFHYYKNQESDEIECFEVLGHQALHRIVLEVNERGSFYILNLKEKRTLKDLESSSYRTKLSVVEAKKEIDLFFTKIKSLIGYDKLIKEDQKKLPPLFFSRA
jgi:hypothetical protein